MKPFVVQTPEIPAKMTKKMKNPKDPDADMSRKLRWRKELHTEILKEKRRRKYKKTRRDLAVTFVIYLPPNLLKRMDVDNVAKGVLDALQGRLGGDKKTWQQNRHKALIYNDNQVMRLQVEKKAKPGDVALGRLTVTVLPKQLSAS
jgi:Holliday junction resolvase RusA-like endonuclease